MSIVGENLKRLVSEKGESLMWLSKISGVSKYTIYTITRSESIDVRPSTLHKLANALGVTVDDLTRDPSIIRENKEVGISFKKTANPYWAIVDFCGSDSSSPQSSFDLNTLIRKKYDITKSPDELQLTEDEKIGYFEQMEHAYSIYWREAHQMELYYNPLKHGEPPDEAVSAILERRKYETILLKIMFDLTPENQIKMVQYGTQLVREQHQLYNELCNNDNDDNKNKEKTE